MSIIKLPTLVFLYRLSHSKGNARQFDMVCRKSHLAQTTPMQRRSRRREEGENDLSVNGKGLPQNVFKALYYEPDNFTLHFFTGDLRASNVYIVRHSSFLEKRLKCAVTMEK